MGRAEDQNELSSSALCTARRSQFRKLICNLIKPRHQFAVTLSLGSGFARLRLARAAPRFRVPLFEGDRCTSHVQSINHARIAHLGRADDC